MKVNFGDKPLTIRELAALCGGQTDPAWDENALTTQVNAICTDSREACVGTAFLAIKGAKVDGHDFISRAGACGAVCAIAERVPADAGDFPVIVVGDVIRALGRLASAYTADRKTLRVAVTGSVGKTTTKEFIASVLGTAGKVYRSEGNFNSVIGMPMSLLAMPADADYAVFEMGMAGLGEISFMSRVCRPHAAVVTNVGTSHLEYLKTRENIAKAKLEIAEGLDPDGILLLCGGEPLLADVWKRDGRAHYFSAEAGAASDFCAVNIRSDASGSMFDAYCRGKKLYDLEVPVPGMHNVSDALCAVSVAYMLGIDGDRIRRGLAAFRPVAMRQQFLSCGGAVIIRDCYNASPESMRSACDVLCTAAAGGGRRLALLGDMYELGETSPALHRSVGRYFAGHGIDRLFTLGALADEIANGAAEIMPEEHVIRLSDKNDIALAAETIRRELREGDVLLVKASRAVGAERVVDALCADS